MPLRYTAPWWMGERLDTYSQLTRAWRSRLAARSASRLEDDANPEQLATAQQLQDEAERACAALPTGAGAPTGGMLREHFLDRRSEELRTLLAARRLELSWNFVGAHGRLARRAWRALSRSARVALATGAVGLVGLVQLPSWLAPTDLALGRSWTASSADYGAAERGRLRGSSEEYFFHTRNEQGPFLEIDLGRSKRIERVTITNRKDCCQSRALPLVLEASEDRKRWRPLARRERPFARWQASFEPTGARFVRLSVPRVTALHLENVAVY